VALISFRAGQTVTSGNFLRVVGSGVGKGFAFPANCGSLAESICVGVAINSAEQDGVVIVNKDYIYDGLPGLTPGERVYLSLSSGQVYTSYNAFDTDLQASTLSGMYLVELGTALATNKLHVEIKPPKYIER
jgi:hypothetical protein